ncbi:MAG: hypothetical protein ACM31E_09335, partial [Fibrobacterota bacterium]
EILFPLMPQKYCVPVQLSGSIADEMSNALKNLSPEIPQFAESFEHRRFQFQITNNNIPEQKRELLSGVMNPLELIDIIVNSLLKYKSPEKCQELVAETSSAIESSDRNTIRIVLKPKGTRFSYFYEDNGAYIQESFLITMAVVLDTSTSLVRNISLTKVARQFGAQSTDQPIFDTTKIMYDFVYTPFQSNTLPSRLAIFTNGKPGIEIEVSYRSHGSLIVFDKKSVKSIKGDTNAELRFTYGEYVDTPCKFKTGNEAQVNRRLLAAAELSRKTLENMRNGNISDAARNMRTLVEKFSDTPQAIEASRILSQLPTDLR